MVKPPVKSTCGGDMHDQKPDVTATPWASLAGARSFVALVYIFLAGGFIASPWLLYSEFKDHDPLMLAIAHSHLFIFFPTFGLLALAAFYLPSVIFTDLYWHHLPYGRLRFMFGFAVAIGLAVWASVSWLGDAASPRAIWEVAPRALNADRGEPSGCMAGEATCVRGSVMPVLNKLRVGAQETTSLSKFGRACKADPYLEVPLEHNQLRWCFPANRKLNTRDCCQSQAAFTRTVDGHYRTPGGRSHLASMDKLLQPIKSFFIVVVLAIGMMLVVWQHQVRANYPRLHFRMERHIFIGALAMLIWPVMDYAYLDTTNALFGRPSPELQPRLSLVVVPGHCCCCFITCSALHAASK